MTHRSRHKLAGSENGVIVVDSVTTRLARGLVDFQSIGTIYVKGKAVPVEVYTPLQSFAGSVSTFPFSRSDKSSVCTTSPVPLPPPARPRLFLSSAAVLRLFRW